METLEILRNMRTILKNDRLVHGRYVDDEEPDPELAGSICGGHKFCAVGSLWAAAGIQPKRERWGLVLESARPGLRLDFMADRPALRDAYDALNRAAERFQAREGIILGENDGTYLDALENLFERGRHDDGSTIEADDLLAVVNAAIKSVKADG